MTLKTHSGAKKRFLVTGKGKIKMKTARLRHNMRKRSHAMKRAAGLSRYVFQGDAGSVRQMLPHA